MDLHLGEDFYDSFVEYQGRMLKVFDRMCQEYGFHSLNASRSIRSVAADLRRAVSKLLYEDKPSVQPAEISRVRSIVSHKVSVMPDDQQLRKIMDQ